VGCHQKVGPPGRGNDGFGERAEGDYTPPMQMYFTTR
jgi:hypothetical protein